MYDAWLGEDVCVIILGALAQPHLKFLFIRSFHHSKGRIVAQPVVMPAACM
jgi:hypothetical protein